MSIFFASYDGFTYKVSDPVFHWHIENGKSEPYPLQLAIVKKFQELSGNRNGTCLDIGAHFGTTMLPFSKFFHNVVGFEGNLQSYALCSENIEKNKEEISKYGSVCSLRNVAISDKLYSGEMILHGSNSGCYYFKESQNGSVKTTRIDDETFSENGNYDALGKIDFIKIDTEGSELSVLKSAENTLKIHKPFLQVETNGCSEKFFGIPTQEIHDYLFSLGYKKFLECEEAIKDESNTFYW
jgi:FkbM family methyltransferase